jgi:hypothetical protein
MNVSGQLDASPALPSGERVPGTHWIGVCVDPRVCLDAVETRKILHCQELNPGHPTRSPSLYRLSYPVNIWQNNCYLYDSSGITPQRWSPCNIRWNVNGIQIKYIVKNLYICPSFLPHFFHVSLICPSYVILVPFPSSITWMRAQNITLQ